MALSLLIVPPCGTVPAVTWTPPPEAAPLAATPMLAEKIDVGSGDLLSLVEGLDPVDAWVLTQLRTVRGSGSAVQDQGHSLTEIENNDTTTPALVAYEIDRMLKPAVDRGDIEVVSRIVQAGDDAPAFDMAAVQLVWRNLRTSKTASLEGGIYTPGAPTA